ncbi:MAG: type II toxin-antitoxin system death-on-curing family toxin [Planctomycetes bacterium]|nr:type II toxin-antitoxin system death-on-curing family toxin [Planctomycetota bacterium]
MGIELVLWIHAESIARFGGSEGVRDAGLLASALERPKHRWALAPEPPSIGRLAAAYAFGIARNHPFTDGNKRTAFVVCFAFLARNGWRVEAEPEELYDVFLGLAEGRVDEESLERWLASRLRPHASP